MAELEQKEAEVAGVQPLAEEGLMKEIKKPLRDFQITVLNRRDPTRKMTFYVTGRISKEQLENVITGNGKFLSDVKFTVYDKSKGKRYNINENTFVDYVKNQSSRITEPSKTKTKKLTAPSEKKTLSKQQEGIKQTDTFNHEQLRPGDIFTTEATGKKRLSFPGKKG